MPGSGELPVGFVNGVVSTKDGYFVVPHTPFGRVQIYDRDWKFVRGWNVDASAGTFSLFVTDTNRIHVVTARRQKHFEFDLNGKLLTETTYAETGTNYSSFKMGGDAYVVPTPWFLWVFSSPLFSWSSAALGLGLFAVKDKVIARTKRKQKRKKPAPVSPEEIRGSGKD